MNYSHTESKEPISRKRKLSRLGLVVSLLAALAVTPVAYVAPVSADGAGAQVSVKDTAKRLAVGSEHACVIQLGEVYCWGDNAKLQLGSPTVVGSNTPLKVANITTAVAVSAGWAHTCILLQDGTVKCWGDNSQYQLGTTGASTSTPTTVSGLTDVSAISAGRMFTCAIVGSARGIKCWGENSSFSPVLARDTGSATRSATPDFVTEITSGASLLAAGEDHACVLLDGGSIKCWGANNLGTFGNGTQGNTTLLTGSTSTVITTGGLSGVIGLTAGSGHTCAVTSDSKAWCWGDGFEGALGYNSTDPTPQTVPVRVITSREDNTALSGIVDITAGYSFTCASKTSGAVSCWGNNDQSQLGTGLSSAYILAPVTATGAAGAVTVAAGFGFACSLSATSIAYCWGLGSKGQIGHGASVNASTPTLVSPVLTQTITFGSLVNKSVADGAFTISATSNSGGATTFTSKTTAVCTVSGTTVTLVSAGTCTISVAGAASGLYKASTAVDQSFLVTSVAATVTTTAATSIQSSKATLNGTVNPNGASTTVEIGYALDGSPLVWAAAGTLMGNAAQDVSLTISSLSADTEYKFAVRATNASGTVMGSTLSFTTGRPVGVSINDADEFTKSKKVTVYVTGTTGSVSAILSNDGGFKTFTKVSLINASAVVAWTLLATKDERLPKIVYVKYVSSSGSQSLAQTDDIILDTTVPVMTSATGTATTARNGAVTVAAVRAPKAKNGVKLTIKASDANSGIGKVEVRKSAKGKITIIVVRSPKAKSRTITVKTRAKKLWVRVVDRAGNASKWVVTAVK